MTALDKNDPIWHPKSIPTPTDTQGLAKKEKKGETIIIKAFQPQSCFLKEGGKRKLLDRGRESENQRGRKTEALCRVNDLLPLWVNSISDFACAARAAQFDLRAGGGG